MSEWEAWAGRAWQFVDDAGHLSCGGWTADGRDEPGAILCRCGARLELAAAA